MKRSTALILATMTALTISAALTPADATRHRRPRTDFALFDGTNPANTNSGAVCYVNGWRPNTPWNFNISVSSFGGTGFKLIYKDGDFIPFQVPTGTSFSMSQAGGSHSSSAAVRVDNSQDAGAAGLAGTISGRTGNVALKVTCLSCDNDADGDAACDAIIPN